MISTSSVVIAAWRRAVVLDGQLLDQVAGVARGIVHRGHLAALLRRRILAHRAEQLDRDVARQQVGEDLFLVGLVVDRGRAPVSADAATGAAIAHGGMICCSVGSCVSTDLKFE